MILSDTTTAMQKMGYRGNRRTPITNGKIQWVTF